MTEPYVDLVAGQKVTVFNTKYEPYAVTTVKRVTKAFAELENGEKFQVNGCDQYPMERGRWGGHRSARPWKQEDSDVLRRERLRSKVILWCDDRAHFKNLSLEQLDTLARAINEVDPTYFKPKTEKKVLTDNGGPAPGSRGDK